MDAFLRGRAAERQSIVDWLHLVSLSASTFPDTDPEGHKWALAGDWADEIQNKEHLKCS